MKLKKMMAMLLSVAMVGSLAACGSSSDAATTDAPATETPAATTEAAPADVDYGSGTITIWVAENVVDYTQEKCDEFFAANPEMAGYTVEIQPTGEGDAAGNMITDVEAGADIFGFAQDQLGRLVSAGALQEVTGDFATFVEESNDAGSVAAAKVGSSIYAFPMTSDNGYFLYYDKSVVTDPTKLETIVADCEAAGKNVYFEVNSGWYQTAFFFGTGCKLEYTTDDTGAFTGSNITYASPEGVAAMKGMINLTSSKAFVNGSSVGNATNIGAIVDGTWDAQAAKDALGDNYACAKLPTFNVDGTDYQLSGFGGFKLLGVKPQVEAGKAVVCFSLAKFLTDAEAQVGRYNAVAWGPSNLTAQQDAAVQADEALSALAEQLAFTIPQGQYPGDYWNDATSLGDSIIAGDYNSASDEDITAALQDFQDKEAALAQ